MTIHTWTEVIIYNDDGWGYRIAEGDEGEIVVYYREDFDNKIQEREHFRVYNSEADRKLLMEILNKMEDMK